MSVRTLELLATRVGGRKKEREEGGRYQNRRKRPQHLQIRNSALTFLSNLCSCTNPRTASSFRARALAVTCVRCLAAAHWYVASDILAHPYPSQQELNRPTFVQSWIGILESPGVQCGNSSATMLAGAAMMSNTAICTQHLAAMSENICFC